MGNPSNSPGRLLAPVALVVAFLVFVIVIASSGGGGGGGGGAGQSEAPTKEKTQTSKTKTPTKDTTYIVKPGDSLTTIAERTGIPLDRLVQLNPDVDPQALISGQCIALTAPSQCK